MKHNLLASAVSSPWILIRKHKKMLVKRKLRLLWRFVKKKLRLGRFLLASRRSKILGAADQLGGRTTQNKRDLRKSLFEEVEAPKGSEWSLIPGLPHEVSIQCLARVPRTEHRLLKAVCKAWRWIIGTPQFLEHRRRLGCAEDWLYLHVATSPHLSNHRDSFSSSSFKRTKWRLAGGFSSWHVLDPHTHKWHALPPVPYSVRQVVLGATSVVMNGNLYVIGGAPFGKAAIRDVWVYNPTRNKWKPAAKMLIPRFGCLAGTIHNKLYVVGGSGICHLTGYSLPGLEVYNPKTNTWSFKASARNMPTPLKYGAVVENKLCVIGAQDSNTSMKASMYDPVTDSWMETKPGLASRWGRATTVMDGMLYTLNSGCYQQYVAQKDSWLPVKGGGSANPLLHWDNRLVSAMAGSNGKLYMVGTMGPALVVVIVCVKGGEVKQNICWHTMRLPNGVDFLGDLGQCSCQVITI